MVFSKLLKIDFVKTDGTYTLQDALYLPDDHALTDVDIESMKQSRFDNWVAVITAPEVRGDASASDIVEEV